MGLRGPAPKPTAQRKAEGNPSRRPLPENEPEYRLGVPECPSHLGEEARAEWDRIAPMLDSAGVLTEADYMALANLCQAYVTMQKAQVQLDKTGLLMKTATGYVQQSPLIGIVNSSMHQITRLCQEFGLTPASRTRIAADPALAASSRDGKNRMDPIEEALCGRGIQ